jgi:hypothetical protein
MKSRILATTAANRRDPIVLLNFQINYFLPSQMRAKFPRFCAQTHVLDKTKSFFSDQFTIIRPTLTVSTRVSPLLNE